MEEEAKPNISLVVGQTIGEIRALHRRLDSLEREISTVTQKLERKPSRSERYLLIFMTLLLALLVAAAVVLFRMWASGRPLI